LTTSLNLGTPKSRFEISFNIISMVPITHHNVIHTQRCNQIDIDGK
jgi:hypothetical protein